jgi:DnaJ-domain-containing protein 1
VSIGKRLIDLARSELNNLLDRAAEAGDDDDERPSPPPSPAGRRVRLQDLSDDELEAEIERRRLDRELDERSRRAHTASQTSRPHPPPTSRPRAAADPIARAYAALEVPVGSDFDTVRKAYRTMMRKYHPDRHAAAPEKQKTATELAQRLTESYKLLEKHLRR